MNAEYPKQRTDLYCTECNKNFIAVIDLNINGNHVIECPYCRHEHCRVVTDGKVTEERWSSRVQRTIKVDKSCVWRSGDIPAATSAASSFIRQAWLDKVDLQL